MASRLTRVRQARRRRNSPQFTTLLPQYYRKMGKIALYPLTSLLNSGKLYKYFKNSKLDSDTDHRKQHTTQRVVTGFNTSGSPFSLLLKITITMINFILAHIFQRKIPLKRGDQTVGHIRLPRKQFAMTYGDLKKQIYG